FHSCNQAVFVFGSVLFYAGIFINVGKSILRPVQILRYLGINVDSLRCRFWVPEDRVQKLVSQIQRILEAGWVSFGELEQVIGRCVSMATAVNCAMLYTREQYRAVLTRKDVAAGVRIADELKEELSMWLMLPTHLINGSPWPNSQVWRLRVEGSTDASSRRWGGRGRALTEQNEGPAPLASTGRDEGWFVAAGDFDRREVGLHIAEKEALALVRVFKGFLENRPSSETNGALFLFRCDSSNVVDIYNRGGSNNQVAITRACKELFLLQLKFQCTLKLEWIPTGENKEADELTREDPHHDVILANWMFLRLCELFAFECDVDLMASSANVQRARDGRKLEFYSRYYNEGCAGVDALSVDVCWYPGMKGARRAMNFCFPPQPLIFSVLNHLRLCGACAIVVL
ncbi:unnamed protein product, partial [Heterosigma akashiwo]